MRRLAHPKVEDITVEGILFALSEPVRLHIFMELAASDCAKNCSAFLQTPSKPLPKSTLSQHFKILREAGLIYSERKGVELHNRTRCSELKPVFGTMIAAIIETYVRQNPPPAKRKAARKPSVKK